LGSTITWSQDSKKLAYIAEKKVPKPKPFFGSYVKKDESSKEDKPTEVETNTRVCIVELSLNFWLLIEMRIA